MIQLIYIPLLIFLYFDVKYNLVDCENDGIKAFNLLRMIIFYTVLSFTIAFLNQQSKDYQPKYEQVQEPLYRQIK